MRNNDMTARYWMDKFVMRSANGDFFKAIMEKPFDNIAAVAQQRALLDLGKDWD
jgi:hypothetical protein